MSSKVLYKPSDFNRIAEFGSIKTTSDSINHQPVKKFVPQFQQHYASIRRGFAITVQLHGTSFEDSTSIVVQHNPEILDSLLVMIDGEQYNILNISPDEQNQTIKYDSLTLKKVKKSGGTNG